jgi:hypothetical protein
MELLSDQLTRDPQGCAIRMRQGLRTSKSSIGRADGTRRGKNLTVSLQHRETCALIGQPFQCTEGNEAVCAHND